jgi:hypothetical protein
MSSGPPHQTPTSYDLRSVLETCAIGHLKVGAPSSSIEAELGPPSSEPSRLSRRAKIWVWQYGNVSILVSGGAIEGMNIDVEGVTTSLVRAGELLLWTLDDWLAYALHRGWSRRDLFGVVNLLGKGIEVSLGPAGHLHMVSLHITP